MRLITYDQQYRQDFIDLNIAWLERFFMVEPVDQEMLDHVDEYIDQGGMVYFALDEYDQVLATCMVIPLENYIWEICKFAAIHQYTGTGAGSAVFKACMDHAITHGAQKISLISCRSLLPAIHIYRKFGFVEVPLNKDYWKADKADIEMEYRVENSMYQ